LVNGDDAVFTTNQFGYELWVRMASLCGLRPSIGKVYFSDTFLNINSTTFDYSLGLFRRVPCTNMGLMYGLRRSSTTSDVSYITIGSRVTQMVAETHPLLQERVLCQFIHKNRRFLNSLGIPWFLPERLLGLGFPTIGKYGPQKRDLIFLSNISKKRRPALPRSSWRCWNYASARFDSRKAIELVKDNEYNSLVLRLGNDCLANSALGDLYSADEIKGLMAVEALFRSSSINDLYDPSSVKLNIFQAEMAYYRRLRKIWSATYREGPNRTDQTLADYPPQVKINSLKFFEKGGADGVLPPLRTLNIYVPGEDHFSLLDTDGFFMPG